VSSRAAILPKGSPGVHCSSWPQQSSKRANLFRNASNTDWQRAGVTHATMQQMMVRGLIEREGSARAFALNDQGGAVLAALLAKA
jgi:hypothetical protein